MILLALASCAWISDEDAIGRAALFRGVAAGEGVSCSLSAADTARCYGLGRDEGPPFEPPMGEWSELSRRGGAQCGITRGGNLDCFGKIEAAELPAADGGSAWMQVANGTDWVCGLHASGGVECFPPVVELHGSFVRIAASPANVCGIGIDGDIVCDSTWDESPVLDGEPDDAVDLGVAGNYGCAILDDESIECWGEEPADPPDDLRAVEIAVGEDHACAIRTEDARVTCWGGCYWGQCTEPRGHGFEHIAAAFDQVCGVTTGGAFAYCWGGGASDDTSHVDW